MSRFVLVHGAFHGAWCWAPVADRLRAAGHSVSAIDLPGSGEDATPVESVNLKAYARRIAQELESDAEPAILVGHSMGGIAVTQAAADAPGSVEQVIYVAAFLPRNGDSLLSLASLPEGVGDGVQANMVVAGDPPVATMPVEKAVEVFYGNCAPADGADAASKIAGQPIVPFVDPVEIDDAAEVKRRYVLSLRDKAIPPALQRRMAEGSNVTDIVELDTDHSPFLSRPDELTEILIGFAS